MMLESLIDSPRKDGTGGYDDTLKENILPSTLNSTSLQTQEDREGSGLKLKRSHPCPANSIGNAHRRLDTAEVDVLNLAARGNVCSDSDSTMAYTTPRSKTRVKTRVSSDDSDAESLPKSFKRKKYIASESESDASDSRGQLSNLARADEETSQSVNGTLASIALDGSTNSDDIVKATGVVSGKVKKRKRARVVTSDDGESSDDEVALCGKRVSKLRPAPGSPVVDKLQKLSKSTLDPDLFDSEGSSDEGRLQAPHYSPSEDESEEEEMTRKLSSKYSGPAARKESKTAKKAVKQDEKLKIYSEKQRMLREQDVVLPVYQPPKKSLREFLSEQAPQLLKALKGTPLPERVAAAKHRRTRIPHRPPKYIEQMQYLEGNPLLYTPCKGKSGRNATEQSHLEADVVESDVVAQSEELEKADSDDDLPDLVSDLICGTAEPLPEDTQSQADPLTQDGDTQSNLTVEAQSLESVTRSISADSQNGVKMSQDELIGGKSPEDDGDTSSSITVVPKNGSQNSRIQTKKQKLRKILGDTVDLDLVPQLSCDPDGVVVLEEGSTMSSQFELFKTSFEKKASWAKELAEKRKKETEVAALRVVRNLPDGSQHELSMHAYSDKTAEQTGGVHKLTLLKQILKAKLSEKRSEEYKKKVEIIKMESIEDELPDDEILEDDYSEASDEEEEGGSDEELGPVLAEDDGLSGGRCEFEKDEALMKRVRAVLDSDEDDDCTKESSKPSSCPTDSNRLAESHMLDSLDRFLGVGDVPAPSEETLASTSQVTADGDKTSQQSVSTQDEGHIDVISAAMKTPNLLDENAQDWFGFSNAKSSGSSGNVLGQTGALGFTHEMFSTQQAEDELIGLCSGQFETQMSSCKTRDHNAKLTGPFTTAIEENGAASQSQSELTPEATATVVSKKKQALQFSDEESEAGEAEVEAPGGFEGEEWDEPASEDSGEDEEVEEMEAGEEGESTPLGHAVEAERELVLHKPRQTKREALMGEYLDKEAELSGDEMPSDEDLDFGDEEDVLELEKGDLDNVGSDEQLRSQIAKAHTKQRIDDDARQLMLMKEMLLPDGDLHSDSKRQRKFRWRNVDYRSPAVTQTAAADSDDSNMSDETADKDPDVKLLHERLDKQRLEREDWLKDQRERRVQQEAEESQLAGNPVKAISEPEILPSSLQQQQQQQAFTFNMGAKRKKPGYVLGKSKKYLERFKELHKNIKSEQNGPISHRNLLFRPISKEDAESQQEMLWQNTGLS